MRKVFVSNKALTRAINAIAPSTPAQLDPAKMLSHLKQFESDNIWFDKNKARLRAKLKNQYVAVHKCRVVGTHRNLDVLLRRLRKQYGNEVGHFAINYLPSKEPQFIVLAAS